MRNIAALCFFLVLIMSGYGFRPPVATTEEVAFYSPSTPPPSHYVIDARVDTEQATLEGRETVSLKNSSRNPIGILAFDWSVGKNSSLEVSAAGRKLYPPPDFSLAPQRGPLFVRLAKPLEPGGQIELEVKFRLSNPDSSGTTTVSNSRWYPRLWWDGRARHDSYSVRLDVPGDWALAASGRLDLKTGRYEAQAAATFGIYLAKGAKKASREMDGVQITSVFTEKGAKAAAVCMEAAADAIHFYKNWLGFYPFPFLTIIPGGSGRWGGYPVATGIVAIHGLETYVDGESPRHWQYITSHEIGHQYWGEWVQDPDNPAWLWIALGIFADTEYMTTRGFDRNRRTEWLGNYINAIPMYYDTTLDIPAAQVGKIRFDRNNTVIHSKGPAAIFALDAVLGRDLFLRIYKKCLRDYGGKELAWKEFQRVCEAESDRNLNWFFNAWVRSNQYLCYSVESRDCRTDAAGYRCSALVRRLGTMAMPIPVKAVFEDGTEQTATTDRNLLDTRLTFTSRAPLRDVILDPERRFAMVKRPLPLISAAAAARLSYGWTSKEAPDIYAALKDEPVATAGLWYGLGTDLYGADRLAEALDCFTKIDDLEADRVTRFAARAWRGLLEDLRGNRAAALERYRQALEIDPGEAMNHSQPRIKIDRAWVEERIKTPYTREK